MSSALRARQAAETAREDEILDRVAELLVEHGYDGLTYEALARRAHVGKATLYARWPGKPALVVDALRREQQREPAADIDTGSLRGDLVALAESLLVDRDRGGRLLLALATAVQSDPVVAQAVQEHLAPVFHQRTRRILDAAVARGELDDDVHQLPYALDLLPALSAIGLLLTPQTGLVADDVVDHLLLPVLTQNRRTPDHHERSR